LGLQVVVNALEAAAVAGAVHAVRLELQDLCDGIAFAEIDGDGADGGGFLEARGYMVDAVDAGGAAQEGGVGAEEPDGAGSEDGYGVTDYEA